MLDALKSLVLRIARVPAEPHTPAGSPGSVRVFRAAPNFWKYLLVVWGIKQVATAFAIYFFLSLTAAWQVAAHQIESQPAQEQAKAQAQTEGQTPPSRKARRRREGAQEALKWHRRAADGLHTLELIGLGIFIVQIPFSLAKARLDYEMRWYIVTDRSMRLREGIFGVREMTFTFANVQNIAIRQGPLQRLLGIADVVVRTAGGGGGSTEQGEYQHAGKPMHVGTLRAVDNAEMVRDLILERLRRLRDAGLGDPDDRHPAVEVLRDAARELLEAARALRPPPQPSA